MDPLELFPSTRVSWTMTSLHTPGRGHALYVSECYVSAAGTREWQRDEYLRLDVAELEQVIVEVLGRLFD